MGIFTINIDPLGCNNGYKRLIVELDNSLIQNYSSIIPLSADIGGIDLSNKTSVSSPFDLNNTSGVFKVYSNVIISDNSSYDSANDTYNDVGEVFKTQSATLTTLDYNIFNRCDFAAGSENVYRFDMRIIYNTSDAPSILNVPVDVFIDNKKLIGEFSIINTINSSDPNYKFGNLTVNNSSTNDPLLYDDNTNFIYQDYIDVIESNSVKKILITPQ